MPAHAVSVASSCDQQQLSLVLCAKRHLATACLSLLQQSCVFFHVTSCVPRVSCWCSSGSRVAQRQQQQQQATSSSNNSRRVLSCSVMFCFFLLCPARFLAEAESSADAFLGGVATVTVHDTTLCSVTELSPASWCACTCSSSQTCACWSSSDRLLAAT